MTVSPGKGTFGVRTVVARGDRSTSGARLGVALWATAALVLVAGLWASARPGTPTKPPVALRQSVPAQPRPTVAPPALTAPALARGYWVRFGPVADLQQLGNLVDRVLERHGVVGRVQTEWTVRAFRVTSAALRARRAAEERCRLLAAVGLPCDVREQPDGSYLLDFGEFRDGAAAQRTARAVRARGYSAVVHPVRTPSYAVVVGPLDERAALALARTLHGSGVPFSLTRR
ncbi:MAG: SPOR domain-containing protein [Firmicutes bacterium]|nr:SPOR domain-containing protein [Bacillota bacterium]